MTTWTDDELSRIGRARPLLICSRSASAIVSYGPRGALGAMTIEGMIEPMAVAAR
jgi:hypothetical protein